MKILAIVSVLAVVGAVIGYGWKLRRDDVELDSAQPGFYEHFAQLQLRARLDDPGDSLSKGRHGKGPTGIAVFAAKHAEHDRFAEQLKRSAN